MAHTKVDAPKGHIYRYKKAENDFARTAFIGNGRSIEDYELITDAEYQVILAEQEKANEPI